MLKSVEWKYFKLEDLFEISSGKRLKKMDHIDGDIKYVSSTQYNNGVDSSIGNGFTHKNAITVGAYGGVGESFYHPYRFWASDSVNVITPKNISLNNYIGLFLVSIIRQEQYRYSYGRGLSASRLRSTSIKLPINSKGDPNWRFMEDYMKSLSEGNLEEYSLPKNNVRLNLNDREWGNFKLEDLFEIERGKQNYISKMSSGPYPYISATEQNNGVSGFVDKYTNEGGVITLNYDGSIGEAFYQPSKFCSSEKIAILKLKNNINLTPELSLFIITILKKEKYRYGYGRKWSIQSRLKPTIIKLPIKSKSSPDEKSEPDWKFMEDYIKGLPYTNKL